MSDLSFRISVNVESWPMLGFSDSGLKTGEKAVVDVAPQEMTKNTSLKEREEE